MFGQGPPKPTIVLWLVLKMSKGIVVLIKNTILRSCFSVASSSHVDPKTCFPRFVTLPAPTPWKNAHNSPLFLGRMECSKNTGVRHDPPAMIQHRLVFGDAEIQSQRHASHPRVPSHAVGRYNTMGNYKELIYYYYSLILSIVLYRVTAAGSGRVGRLVGRSWVGRVGLSASWVRSSRSVGRLGSVRSV